MSRVNTRAEISVSCRPLFVCLTILLFFHSPVLGADYLKQAGDFYTQGNYAQARHYLEHIIKHQPTNWQAHYLLGNTYLKQGENELARSSYEQCILNVPDAQTSSHCQKAIAHIDLVAIKKNEMQTAESKIEEKRSARDEAVLKEHEQKVQALTKRREEILEPARKEAAKIRKEARDRLEYESSISQRRMRNTVTGQRSLGIPTYYADEVMAEAEERARKVMESAEARARGIVMPKPPVLHSRKYTEPDANPTEAE